MKYIELYNLGDRYGYRNSKGELISVASMIKENGEYLV